MQHSSVTQYHKLPKMLWSQTLCFMVVSVTVFLPHNTCFNGISRLVNCKCLQVRVFENKLGSIFVYHVTADPLTLWSRYRMRNGLPSNNLCQSICIRRDMCLVASWQWVVLAGGFSRRCADRPLPPGCVCPQRTFIIRH